MDRDVTRAESGSAGEPLRELAVARSRLSCSNLQSFAGDRVAILLAAKS
jgi:hypothetical protein